LNENLDSNNIFLKSSITDFMLLIVAKNTFEIL